MSTQTVAFNFKDLINLSTENLLETIPTRRAVAVTLDASKSAEVPSCEIYKSWATGLFQRYGPTITISDADLNQLLNVFSSAIEEVLNECREFVNDAQHSKLVTFLDYSMELFTWIRSVASEFRTNEITVFLCFGLSVINNYLVVLSKQTSDVNATLLEKSLAMQSLILRIFLENPNTFYFDNDSGSMFSNLMGHLCAVGELTPNMDIKTAVDTWKSITKLAAQHVSHTQSGEISSEDIIWLKRPMTFLITEVGRNVKTVYKENSLSEPIQQIEKYLKVTNFYLRLLQKLTADFRHLPFPVCEDFLNTLSLVLTPPVFIVNTPVHKVILEFITKGLRVIIPFAYRNELFFELLLSEHRSSNSDESFHEILLEVMELAIRRNEVECLNPQLLDAAFERVLKSAYILESTSAYNRFVERLSSLQMHFHLEHVQKRLVKSILQDDIVIALVAVDIWCTVFSLSNNSTRLSYLKFWKEVNERFAKFSNRLSAQYVEVLLKNLYSLLTTEEKDGIWNKFNACALNNDRFLLTLGLDAIGNNATKHSIIQHFVSELTRFLKEPIHNIAVADNYYTIVKDLKLLTSTSIRNNELNDMLLRYLEIAMKKKKLNLLAQSILDFIADKLEFIDDSRILKILTALSMELSTFDDHSAKVCLVRFLKSVSKNPRLVKHSEVILKIVETDELESMHKNRNMILKPERNEKFLKEILKRRTMGKNRKAHVCQIDEEMHVNKKLKMSNELSLEKTDVDILCESLENNVNKLQLLAQLSQLNSSHVETIKRVANKLQGIGALN